MDAEIKFVPFYTTSDQGKLALIKSLLDANLISYYVDNEHAASLAFPEVIGKMTIMVIKEQVELAEELLKQFEK